MAAPRVTVAIEDVGGSFARLLREAPKAARARLSTQILATASRLQDRMKSMAPVGSDDAHIRDAITFKQRGMYASVGYLEEDFGNDPAGAGQDATMAEVALYNEYSPNKQSFMRPAAESEATPFRLRMEEALKSIETMLRIGGGH